MGENRHLLPNPSHAGDTAKSSIRKEIKCRGGEIKISELAGGTAVDDGDRDTLASVCCKNLFATNGVLVGVGAVIPGEAVEQQLADSDDVVRRRVRDAACSETRCEKGTLAGLCAR